MAEERGLGRTKSRLRRYAEYALGIVIEASGVIAISLLALLLMLIIKAIMA